MVMMMVHAGEEEGKDPDLKDPDLNYNLILVCVEISVILFIGYMCGKARYINHESAEGLEIFSGVISLPCLLFYQFVS